MSDIFDKVADDRDPLKKLLSKIPGFIKVQHGDVQMLGTMTEKVAVKNYLEGGFFYE